MSITSISQWVAMMLVAGQNYIDSSGSAIQCMQDKGNGKNTLVAIGIAKMLAYDNTKDFLAMEMVFQAYLGR